MLRNSTYLPILGFLVCAIVPVKATNYFDGRQENIGSVIRGVTAQFTTSPEPDLHAIDGAISCVWVMVADKNNNLWAQTGYLMRYPDYMDLTVFLQYKRVNGTKISEVYTNPYLTYHTYKLEQDGTTGVWSAFFDGYNWAVSSGNTAWAGTWVIFSGEVLPSTSVQMMGDYTWYYNKTLFNYFWYKPAGGTWTTVWPSSEINDQPLQWGHYDDSSMGYFQIWDMTL